MQSKSSYVNVPMEIVRTIISIQEAGSLTKAATVLGLSQPAVSTQIKRIESLLGGAIFVKTPNGSTPTELGTMVLQQARKMLEANDQMLAIGGITERDHPIRLGLSTILVRPYLRSQSAEALSNVKIHCDRSVELANRLLDGHLDVACLVDIDGQHLSELRPLVQCEFNDELLWVRSKKLKLLPGAPLPIIAWTGGNWMTRTLVSRGVAYRIVFSADDYDAKRAAVEAGLGLSAMMRSQVDSELIAPEDYLPKLPSVKGLLCVRPGVDVEKSRPVTEALLERFFQTAGA